MGDEVVSNIQILHLEGDIQLAADIAVAVEVAAENSRAFGGTASHLRRSLEFLIGEGLGRE